MVKILLIDDSELVRETLKEFLIPMGCQICEASDGEEGLQVYRDEEPTLVICDINMPNMDGLTFLKRLMDRDADALVVMLTSVEDENVLVECLVSGAQSYLTKPFDPEKTFNTLNTLIGPLL